MGSDNVIYVKKIKGKWWVWHGSASNDRPRPDGLWLKWWPTKKEAMAYAVGLEKGMDYVEYGVRIL